MRNLTRFLALTSLFLAAFSPISARTDAAATPPAYSAVTPSALPEGVHDGAEGTVNAASCSASGWGVDPDDRDRDLQVKILADGRPVATVTADLLREDVTECTGGTCGFGINLWGLISPGVEHQITAQAYDEEAAAWVDLSSTPKSLTCWGYPEGFHDGAQAAVNPDSCYANGWAVDPDDRERDLQVRIFSDGEQVASPIASSYREDMDTLGICPSGTCAWFSDLWGLISPDQEHQITAQVYDEESDAWLNLEATPKSLTCQSPPPPAPIITISTSNDYLRADLFPANAPVTFTLYPSAAEGETALWSDSRTTDENGSAIVWPWEGPPDLVPGNYVVVTDGTSTKDLVLEAVTFDVFDPEHDLLEGTASPGAQVYVWVGIVDTDNASSMWLEADGDGGWRADFTQAGFDITAEMWTWASARVFDGDGDVTIAHPSPLPPPSPWLIAFPENDAVEGWEWPDRVTVVLTVDDPATETSPDLARTGTMAVTPWGDPRTFVHFDFADVYDLKVGDVVTLTDETTPKTHIVLNLSITGTDPEADTIAGTADADAVVQVWPHGFDQTATVQVTANGEGAWVANFSGLFDLVPETGGRSQILDEAGSATSVDWSVPTPPNPWFSAFPEGEVIEGWDWPLDADVHLTINDPATLETPDFAQDGTVVLAPWGSGQPWLWMDFAGLYDMNAGNVVTLTDGVTERTHVVQVLSITDASAEENTVGGMAEAGKSVSLWSWEDAEGRRLLVTANSSGDWAADFDDVGFDLLSGYHVRAEVWDEAANDTAVDWQVPLPVQIDIQPGTRLNLITCRYPALWLPVAVFSTERFDATQLYTDSVRFGKTGTEAEVIRIGRDERPVQYVTDVNQDGLPDMIYVFRFGDTGFSCADIPPGQQTASVVATLKGSMDGGMVEGDDVLKLFRFLPSIGH